jgi:cysteine desulfurase
VIYLDHNASTPLHEDVKASLLSSLEFYGNPSGENNFSLVAANKVDECRELIAELIGVNPQEVIFSTGSSESIAIAIYGVVLSAPNSRNEIFVSCIEHKAVLATCYAAASLTGKKVIEIPVDKTGTIDLEFIESNVSSSTALIACMSANNETGTIQDILKIKQFADNFEIPFFCDSTQSIGKDSNFDFREISGAIAVVSGHKIYGPKGSGLAIIPRSLQKSMFKVLQGGGQERGFRGGTLNLQSIVGITKALEIAIYQAPEFEAQMWSYKTSFLEQLSLCDHIVFNPNSSSNQVLTNTLSLRFEGVLASEIMANLKKVIVSRASACTSGQEEPSHVLLAMGLSNLQAESSLRFSFGRACSLGDMPQAVLDLSEAVDRVQLLAGQ